MCSVASLEASASILQALMDLSDKAKSLDKQKTQLLNKMQSRNHDKPADHQQVQAGQLLASTPEQAAIQQVYMLCCAMLEQSWLNAVLLLV